MEVEIARDATIAVPFYLFHCNECCVACYERRILIQGFRRVVKLASSTRWHVSSGLRKSNKRLVPLLPIIAIR